MADVYLIGTEDVGTQAAASWYGYTIWTQFTAALTGTVNSIKVKTHGATNVKVGIYADNGSNAPGILLGVQNNFTAVASDAYSNVPLDAGASITQNSLCWLAAVFEYVANTYPYYSDGPNLGYYKASTADLASNPTGLTVWNREWCLNGYGSLPVVGRSFGFILGFVSHRLTKEMMRYGVRNQGLISAHLRQRHLVRV